MPQNVMISKLIQDFFEADGVNKLIIKRQVPLEDGILVISELTQDVIDDISILDQETYKKLDVKIKELNTSNNTRKNEIKTQVGKPEDTIEERNLKLKLLKEDHMKYRRLMTLIQEICYRKGWFE